MATLPTTDQIRRAILDDLRDQKLRPGEIFNIMALLMRLNKLGLRNGEITPVLEQMGEEDLIENANSPAFLKLTEAGFAAI